MTSQHSPPPCHSEAVWFFGSQWLPAIGEAVAKIEANSFDLLLCELNLKREHDC